VSDENGSFHDWIMHLTRADAPTRKLAAQVLGDWVYPHGGLPADEVRLIHQALLHAAVIETDHDVVAAQLTSLVWSNRPLVGLEGWDHLLERTPLLPSYAQEQALALLSVSGEAAFADRLEALATQHPAFDHALTRKTIDTIRRTCRPED
jgi:hypothetical protein